MSPNRRRIIRELVKQSKLSEVVEVETQVGQIEEKYYEISSLNGFVPIELETKPEGLIEITSVIEEIQPVVETQEIIVEEILTNFGSEPVQAIMTVEEETLEEKPKIVSKKKQKEENE